MKHKKGFTLIELLVVIAIIGILAGVVLTMLNSARIKSKSSRIQSELLQVRNIAELIYAETGRYDGLCYVNSGLGRYYIPRTNLDSGVNPNYLEKLKSLGDDIVANGGGGRCLYGLNVGQALTKGNTNRFCISSLKPDGTYICYDNTGKVGKTSCTTEPPTSYVGCN